MQASVRPGQAILPSDKASLYFLVSHTKLYEVKKNIKQQITDLGPRNHREVARLFQQCKPGDHTAEPQMSSGAR